MSEAPSMDGLVELEEENLRLKSQIDRLKRFLEIGKLLYTERNINKLLPIIMAETSKLLDADRSTLFLIDLDRMQLWTKYAEGVKDQRISIDLKMGIVGLCTLTGQLLNVTDAYEDIRFHREVDASTGYRTQSILCAPFFCAEGEVLGAIELLNKSTGVFTKADEVKAEEVSACLTRMAQAGELRQDTVEKVLSGLRKSTSCDRGSLFLINKEEKKLYSMVAEGVVGQDIQLNLNLGVAGFVAITGQDVNVGDVYSDPRFDRSKDQKTGYLTRSILCVPIRNQGGEVMGVVQVLNKRSGPFVDADLDLLKALSPQISIAIENAILFEEQAQQSKSILEVLAASIDAKDPLTAGHSQKVAEYSSGIARELGFGEIEVDILNVAALLHDYGKIGVCDSVLKKSGKLTFDEFELIKKHVSYTHNILSRMHFVRKYRYVPLIASCHHERLDGSGYGSGLKGHEIPFMSKILAVADVFEALTATRHYRDALPVEKAFEVLEEGIGTKFDENIVRAMQRFWKKYSADCS